MNRGAGDQTGGPIALNGNARCLLFVASAKAGQQSAVVVLLVQDLLIPYSATRGVACGHLRYIYDALATYYKGGLSTAAACVFSWEASL